MRDASCYAGNRRGALPASMAWALISCLSPPRAFAAAPQIAPYEASYSWAWHGATVAVSTLKLVHRDADVWVYSSTSEARGIGHLYPMQPPKLESVLRISDEGVQPLTFHSSTGSSAHDADVTFDWQHSHASGVYEGTPVDLALPMGVQDDLSVQIALIVDLLRDKVPDTISMIDKNSIRDYRYKREDQQRISTPWGDVDTIVYSSQHEGSARVTRFWCAPSKGYLPMRVEQKRGDSVEWTMEIQTLKR